MNEALVSFTSYFICATGNGSVGDFIQLDTWMQDATSRYICHLEVMSALYFTDTADLTISIGPHLFLSPVFFFIH